MTEFSSTQVMRMFRRHYDRYTYMCKKYPKAAKKARIRKKWRKRYGAPMSEMIAESIVTEKCFYTVGSLIGYQRVFPLENKAIACNE